MANDYFYSIPLITEERVQKAKFPSLYIIPRKAKKDYLIDKEISETSLETMKR